MKILGSQVAAILGESYYVKAHDGRIVNIGNRSVDRQFGIVLIHMPREKKIDISGEDLKAIDGFSFDIKTSIRVGDHRTATAIASEIINRFFTEYRQELKAKIIQRDKHDQFVTKRDENLKKFAHFLGGEIKGELVKVDMRTDYKEFGYINKCQVYGDSVNLEFSSVPVEIALELAKTWKKFQK
jgi:hypothetical protein